jgi:N-methylhydantoinase B
VLREYEVLEGEISFSHRGERHFSAAPGVNGGGAGAKARSIIRRADGREEIIPSKIVTTLRKGDRLLVETAGGGGYGDPKQRLLARVQEDVRNGKISPESARSIYGEAERA